MKKFQLVAALVLACALLAVPTSTAFAGGPVDNNPPDTIELSAYLTEVLTNSLETANQHRVSGPAPCLDVANYAPDLILVGQQGK